MKNLNLVIVTSEPFPEGMAATNRILSYSKGIFERGVKVKILSFKPARKHNFPLKGKYNNIEYNIISKRSQILNNKLLIPIYFSIGIINSFFFLLRFRSKCSKNIILLVSNKPLLIFTFYIYAKIFGYKYLQEKSEFPFVLNKNSYIGKWYAKLYVNNFYRLFDGIIVMTNELMDYFKQKIRKDARLFKLPMTVEMDRFIATRKIFPFEYVSYCGYMGGEKDGVSILIKAFGLIAQNFPQLKLVLIGDGPKEDMDNYKRSVLELKIESQVVFTGNISRNEIPNYLCNAKILTLARPRNLQSSGGFPSKLGEYLSTGNPVVVTSVGEITEYLEDEKNAFIAEPDNAASFAVCLKKALTNYDNAKTIGLEGRCVAANNFDYKVQSEKLVEFLKTV